MNLYILTHEYSDKSGFQVCGVTQSHNVALAWFRAGDENYVYRVASEDIARWMDGHQKWAPE